MSDSLRERRVATYTSRAAQKKIAKTSSAAETAASQPLEIEWLSHLRASVGEP
jgi:hypothetical protein